MRHSSCRFAEPGPRFLRTASSRSHSASKTRVNALKALQRTVPQVLHAALRPGHAVVNIGEKNFSDSLSTGSRTSLILLPSCPMRGRFLEAISQRTERKLAGPGRPGTVDRPMARWSAGRRSACLGRARFTLPREVGSPPASRVSRWAPWRLPPLHPLARLARDWQTSDALRRENAEAWLFEIRILKFSQGGDTHSAVVPAQAGTHALRRRDAESAGHMRKQLAKTITIGGYGCPPARD
jgi:hypothetical protein